MTQTLNLKKGKLYQVAFIAPHKESELKGAADLYFGDGKNIAEEHGGVLLMALNVTDIEHSDIDVEASVVLEWPSLEALEQFQADERWLLAQHKRDGALKDINMAAFKVSADAAIAFEDGGLYEFAGFWMNRQNAGLMPQYFEAMGPVVKQARPKPLAAIEPIHTSSPYDLKPDKFNFLSWGGGLEAREHMFKSQEFKDSGYMRALALDRLLTVMVEAE